MPLKSTKVAFKGRKGQALAGRLDRPPGPAVAFALFAHCFTCAKDVIAASRISKGLAEHGIATLRFNFTGLGQGPTFAAAEACPSIDPGPKDPALSKGRRP